MDQFNLNAVSDKRELAQNDAKHAARSVEIIEAGKVNLNAQLIKDFIEIQGLDVNRDRDEIIALCEEIGVDPIRVGIELEQETPNINRSNIDTPQIDNDGRDEK